MEELYKKEVTLNIFNAIEYFSDLISCRNSQNIHCGATFSEPFSYLIIPISNRIPADFWKISLTGELEDMDTMVIDGRATS